MSAADLLRRITKLEQPKQVRARLTIVFSPAPGEVFHGYRCMNYCNFQTDFDNLKEGEFFDVHGTDPATCAAAAEIEAHHHWPEFPALLLALRPITTQPEA